MKYSTFIFWILLIFSFQIKSATVKNINDTSFKNDIFKISFHSKTKHPSNNTFSIKQNPIISIPDKISEIKKSSTPYAKKEKKDSYNLTDQSFPVLNKIIDDENLSYPIGKFRIIRDKSKSINAIINQNISKLKLIQEFSSQYKPFELNLIPHKNKKKFKQKSISKHLLFNVENIPHQDNSKSGLSGAVQMFFDFLSITNIIATGFVFIGLTLVYKLIEIILLRKNF